MDIRFFPGVKAKITTIAKSFKKLGQDDPRRLTHSFKVGLALTLVSLLYYARPLYNGFGVAGMWAVLTVVVVFEFTVGGTLSKCLNRGFATFLAGGLGIAADYFASLFGKKGEPIVLGILVFLLAAAATYTRFFPRMKARYDYGVMIFILTFSMVAVSGYRVDELVVLAHQRLSTIALGGATCMIISIFICPVWAGDDLHNEVASNLEKLATYLEGFGDVYFVSCKDEGSGVDSKDDNGNSKSLSQGYKSILNSKNNEESLENFARWEPGHGGFQFRHPWKHYLKIGAHARQCAYNIEVINICIDSDNQVSEYFKRKIEGPYSRMSAECGKALKALATSMKTMTHPSTAKLNVDNSKAAMKDLKFALEAASIENADLLAIVPAATVGLVLVEIAKCVEKISEAMHELSERAHFSKTVEPTVSPEKPQQLLHGGIVRPVSEDTDDAHNGNDDNVVITIHEISSDSPENEKSDEHRVPRPGQV
ncbi:Aluminum-activated malate transporter 8 [Hibiscus syriacus]|uniref:Aluminum-activated malate transporter 8 n=1 Tax=Hibiscus syriacus TaxID=106335 RepID=A0A6A2YE25_HIBSY|nr:aluminum-activated malate transporter 8-like [Hibiscus syriacus]KAE8672217.1 Aluminum-activated malate transporter 8 [Hibiscus syriacus]